MQAQDIHFSQDIYTPMLTNPAMAGLISGDIRADLVYRNQGFSFMGANSYKTYLASVDGKVWAPDYSDNWLGAGILLYTDKAGDLDFSTTEADLSIAYVIGVSEKTHVSAGLQVGFVQQGFDLANAQFGSQFVDGSFNENAASGENIDQTSISFAQVGAGLMFVTAPELRQYLYGGAAFFHANTPDNNFFDDSRERLDAKWVLQLGGSQDVSNNFDVVPSAYFSLQGASWKVNASALLRYVMYENSREGKLNSISFGPGYRVNGGNQQLHGDALLLMAQMDIEHWQVGVGYDITLSSLKNANNGSGAIEVALSYMAALRTKSAGPQFNCPRF